MKTRARWLLGGVAFWAVLTPGCSGGESSPVGPLELTRLTLIEGQLQEGTPGVPLPIPFTVRIATPTRGVAGVRVDWTVLSGDGVFEPSATVVTDEDGLAQVRFTPSTRHVTVLAIGGDGSGDATFRMTPVPTATYERATYAWTQTVCVSPCDQFRLYPDGTFGLRNQSLRDVEGTFVRNDSVLAFTFARGLGGGTAEGLVRGDSLFITFDIIMALSDYEDGRFVLKHGH